MATLYKIIKHNVKEKISSTNIQYPKNYPQVEPQRRCPNIDKIKNELGFINRVSMNSSVKRFYEWSKKYY